MVSATAMLPLALVETLSALDHPDPLEQQVPTIDDALAAVRTDETEPRHTSALLTPRAINRINLSGLSVNPRLGRRRRS